jgi:hypothetical protein
MDTIFITGEVVEAVDTHTGIWGLAKILEVKKESVRLYFIDFPANVAELQIHIGPNLQSQRFESSWPIRKPSPCTSSKKLPPRRRTALNYLPHKRIAGDPVRAKVGHQDDAEIGTEFQVLINDPFNEAIICLESGPDFAVVHADVVHVLEWEKALSKQLGRRFTYAELLPTETHQPVVRALKRPHSDTESQTGSTISEPHSERPHSARPHSATGSTIAEQSGSTIAETIAEPLLFQQQPPALLIYAPCANGLLKKGCEVILDGTVYVVNELVAKDKRAFVHLFDAKTEREVLLPAAGVHVVQSVALTRVHLPSIPSLPHLAWSVVKSNLMQMNIRRAKVQANFDVMAFDPIFVKAFGFRCPGAEKAEYNLEEGTTKDLDCVLGLKWDLVGKDEDLLITNITFRRVAFSPISATEKLRCNVRAIWFKNPASTVDYRVAGLEKMKDALLLITQDGGSSPQQSP